MPSSRILAALFGALGLIIAAFAAAPASAAPVSAGTAQTMPSQALSSQGDLVQQAQYYGPRRHYGPRRFYGRPVYRPRCFFANRRVWTGYGWVVRPVRVCR